ncbi:MAG: YebC/PmpR family DNA-binding transcriptional regulator [bacterium]|nr:YebC/PmpR family DNA-binding transcriptional regulator [bacterium]MDZ4231661.1 YebC/PmpR family DNA-binding transcriptional regulator [Candidatus Pacearchaeota archaeon]
MSGHSHAKTVKHKKEAADAKKSKVFSKISSEIALAAKSGNDLASNIRLRLAVDRAKASNMPSDSIERAIKKGTGELAGGQLEDAMYEAYGPGGITLLIAAITDNKNRTLGEIRQALSKNGGKFVDAGGVKWMFEQRAIVEVSSSKSKEEAELAAIEAGAEDLSWVPDALEVSGRPEELENLKGKLSLAGFAIESSSVDWVAKEPVTVSESDTAAAERLLEALDDLEDIQEIYSNLA